MASNQGTIKLLFAAFELIKQAT